MAVKVAEMLQPTQKYYTPEEYLALEEKAKTKSEYFRGKIYQMAGASVNHNRITSNLCGLLFAALEGKACDAFAGDMRLLVQANGLYTSPDIMVVCGSLLLAKNSPNTVINPVAIIEVLSETTAEYDRTDKFDLYKELPTRQNYVMAEQDRPYLQCYQRGIAQSWLVETYHGLEESLYLPSLEVRLPLRQIYNRVEWSSVPLRHPSNQEN